MDERLTRGVWFAVLLAVGLAGGLAHAQEGGRTLTAAEELARVHPAEFAVPEATVVGQVELELDDCLADQGGWQTWRRCGTDQVLPWETVERRVRAADELTVTEPGWVYVVADMVCDPADFCPRVDLQTPGQREWTSVHLGPGYRRYQRVGETVREPHGPPVRFVAREDLEGKRGPEPSITRVEQPGRYRLAVEAAFRTVAGGRVYVASSVRAAALWVSDRSLDEAPVSGSAEARLRGDLDRVRGELDRCRARVGGGRDLVQRLERGLGVLRNSLALSLGNLGAILDDQALQDRLHRVGANPEYVLDALDPWRPVGRLEQRIGAERAALALAEGQCRELEGEVIRLEAEIEAARASGTRGGGRERRRVQ